MKSQIIRYAAGCNSCRIANTFSLILMTEEDDDEPLSRSDLIEEAEPHRIVCPTCGQEGNMSVLFFKINGIYYDMEYPPQNGFIELHAEKRNGKIIDSKLIPSVNGFGSYDCLNSLIIFQKKLEYFYTQWQSNENRDSKKFQSSQDGFFEMVASLKDEPPYISAKTYSARGFSFKDMNELIYKLKKEITDDLTASNMLF